MILINDTEMCECSLIFGLLRKSEEKYFSKENADKASLDTKNCFENKFFVLV